MRRIMVSKHMAHSSFSRAMHLILVVAVLTLGLGLRLRQLDEESLWFDEYVNWQFMDAPNIFEHVARIRTIDATFVPAYYIISYGWADVTGTSVWASRLLSVGMGMISCVLLYLLGRATFGRGAALIALLIMSFSNVHVFYAQELRVYPLFLMAALLSALFLHYGARRQGRWMWIAHFLANTLLVWTHLFGALLVLAEAFYLALFHRRPLSRLAIWFLLHAALAASVGVWLFFVDIEHLRSTIAFIPTPHPADLIHAYAWTHLYTPAGAEMPVLLSVTALFLVGRLGLQTYRNRRRGPDGADTWRACCMLLLWQLVPLTALLVVTYLGRPCLLLRYALHGSLPCCILIGAALSSIRRPGLRAACIAVLAALMILQALGEERPYRPNYALMQPILAARGDGSETLVVCGAARHLIAHYAADAVQEIRECLTLDDMAQHFKEAQLPNNRAWALLSTVYPPNLETFENRLAQQGCMFTSFDLKGGGPSYHAAGIWPALAWVQTRTVLYEVHLSVDK